MIISKRLRNLGRVTPTEDTRSAAIILFGKPERKGTFRDLNIRLTSK
jgi:hypothetical protein